MPSAFQIVAACTVASVSILMRSTACVIITRSSAQSSMVYKHIIPYIGRSAGSFICCLECAYDVCGNLTVHDCSPQLLT